MKQIFVFYFLIITTKVIFCQNESLVLSGKLLDNQSYSPIAYFKIINITRKIFTYTNSNGLYQIICIKKDTLLFSGVGYIPKLIIVNDSILSKTQNFILLLEPEIYELKEVTINDLGTYNDFKRNFLTLKPKKELVINLGLPNIKPSIPKLMDENYIKSLNFATHSPISFLYYNLNEKEKSKRKIYKLLSEVPVNAEIEKKYTRDKVGSWTGLTDIELNEFIVFCNFDRNYLIGASEYEIILKTQEKFKEYQLKKSENKVNK